MAAAHVSIHVGEDVELIETVHVMRCGELRAWVHIDGYDAAVWGSPAALRRFAAAVVAAADSAEQQVREPQLTPVASAAA